MNATNHWTVGTFRRIGMASCIGLWLLVAPVAGQTRSTGSLQRQQREQERARVMATELVSSVLDIQLRQLEENNLTTLPIYAEIKSMRANIGQLIDREMQGVVALLAQGQHGNEKDHDRVAQDARTMIRSIVVALMAERQKLNKRMHLAKLAAQIRQLIGQETKVLNRTRTLSEESPQARERATLATLEDQRDVTAIHFQFVDVLADVATWDGTIGAGASKGMRLLKTLKIDQELRRADQTLAASKFGDAEQAEQATIRGWRALLAVIEETQGLIGADRESVSRMVSGMIKRQEALREQTRQVNSQDQQRTEQLAQMQHEIQQDLGPLADALREFANTEALAERAKSSAFEAEAKLFDGATSEAVQQQGQVIGALAEIEKKLEQAANATSDKTADQLALEVKKLEQLDQALDQVRKKQEEVTAQAAQNAPAAKGAEDQVAQQLQQANQAADFGPALETRLADAQDDVAQAQQVLSNPVPAMAPQRSQAAQESTQAIDLAATEVKQALADARRKQLAVSVGELARAAEALERAAAAEQEIAEAALDGANSDGLTADEAQALGDEQARVNKVAKEIAMGVTNSAPQTAQQLAAAEPVLNAAAQQLQTAQKSPGEAAKPAANQAAHSARDAAKQLELAAKQLRQRAGVTAADLAQLAGQQLQPVVAARQSVDTALAAATANPALAESAGPLQQALAKTRAAQIDQLRASGRQAAADAQQMLDRLAAALQKQTAADEAARDFAQGRANSPLQAAAAQEEVGDFLTPVAGQATGALQQELRAAFEAAEEAAKEMVIGNPNSAAAARQRARDALNRAQQAAVKSMLDAAKVPANPPDADAQQRVSKLAQEALHALADQSPPAHESLDTARQQSAVAAQAMASKQPPVVADAQAKTTAALAKSVEQLQQAIQASANKRAERAQELAQQTAVLATQSLPVDAGASVALEQATNAARHAAAETARGEPASDPQPAVTRGLERATASLAAREQELQRDRDIAEAIAQLAKEQQAARDQIADQAMKLEKFAAKALPAGTPPPPPPAEELAAAQALADAADKFAEAQRATGEGAAEISKQNEVANQPIRQGLETASELGRMPGKPIPPGEDRPMSPAEPANATNVIPAAPTADASQLALGTNFVPRSPEETARRIAGQEALEEAAKALAQQSAATTDPLAGDKAKPSQVEMAENSSDPSESQPTPAQKSAAAKKGEAALAADQQGQNKQLATSQLELDDVAKERDSRAASGNNTADPDAQKFQQEPWFAKLPPSLQKAIQAKSRRTAPRGYEERLKRYFESAK